MSAPPPHDWDPVGPEATADIHGTLARLRAGCPVAGSQNWGGFYTLTRYDDVVAVSKDPATFTATVQTVIPASPRKGLPRLPLQRDPPESDRYRKGLNLLMIFLVTCLCRGCNEGTYTFRRT